MRSLKTAALLCSSLILLAACSSTPKTAATAEQPANTVAQKAAAPEGPLQPVAESKVQSVVIPPYLDPASALFSKRSVYFDYDNFAVKPEYQGMLELHGKYLAQNKSVAIRVEGNTDERGSAEYNLALGQKRAEAVAKTLKLFGLNEAQIEAVSFGKEKPKATGASEAAYAQNRRVDLAYPSK